MTTQNGRGLVNCLALMQDWLFNILPAQIEAVIAEQSVKPWPVLMETKTHWDPVTASPAITIIDDSPEDKIQPKSPALVLTFNDQDVNSPGVMYDYNFTLTYTATTPDKTPLGGDQALLNCGLIAEAIGRAVKIRPAGLNNLTGSGFSVSSVMTTPEAVPLLARILTIELTAQIEEDF